MPIHRHRAAWLIAVLLFLCAASSSGGVLVGALPGLSVSVSPFGAAQISAGGGHTCALTTVGGVQCWGGNWYGQLGDGTTTERLAAAGVVGLASGVLTIASGSGHNCVLTTGGAVKCWGRNNDGQLGDGTMVDRPTPVAVSGLASGVAAIAVGGHHSCALTAAGGVKCWGWNNYGQLGGGDVDMYVDERLTPWDVSGLTSGVTAITAGDYHSCALMAGGGVKCWGSNDDGQLGSGTVGVDRYAPTDVSSSTGTGTLTGIAAIASNMGAHTCALTKTGGVKCWGYNSDGQLGDGTTTDRLFPVDVVGLASAVTAVAVGEYHSCALTAAGGVKCWGDNLGQLGDGTTTRRSTPVGVSGLASGAAAVSAGTLHTCAITVAGAALCWGNNIDGRLGDGTNASSTVPVPVKGFAGAGGTVSSSPAGVACGLTCYATFPGGTVVTLSQTPRPGYAFRGWTGACTGLGACTVKMDAAASVAATYDLGTTPAGSNHQGLWWNAAESGWGINFAHQGDIIFATWFTYDATGKPWWLIAVLSKTADGVYAGPVSTVAGPLFSSVPFGPAPVETEVGSMTATFADPGHGTIAYTLNGVIQTKAITPQAFGALPVCTWGAEPNLALATNYTDLWWNANESGWGVNFTHQGDVIFATWFTYDGQGKPWWLIAVLSKGAGKSYSGPVSTVGGPPFNLMPWNQNAVVETEVGTATASFTDGNAATFAYTVNSTSQTKAITRQVFVAPGTVCQ